VESGLDIIHAHILALLALRAVDIMTDYAGTLTLHHNHIPTLFTHAVFIQSKLFYKVILDSKSVAV
jgi:hypothetical protein